MPALLPVIARLTNLIYATGNFPKVLRRIHLAPLVKAGKDPHQISSRKPISLVGTAVKIAEAVTHQRLLPVIEPHLDEAQYAYRRDRGTEMRLTEIIDSTHRALIRNRVVYLVSFDIKGAFGNVAHAQLIQGLSKMNVDEHMKRVAQNWLVGRTFQVKMATTRGTYHSRIKGITRGLPQGGVLSPLLLFVFFATRSRKGCARKGSEIQVTQQNIGTTSMQMILP